jgi:hypothetical protein
MLIKCYDVMDDIPNIIINIMFKSSVSIIANFTSNITTNEGILEMFRNIIPRIRSLTMYK